MAAPFWTLKCVTGALAGTEKTLAQWGISALKIKQVPNAQDAATFNMIVPAADAEPVFNLRDQAALYFTDSAGVKTRRFLGVWTKTPTAIQPGHEAISFELSGAAWYYLSRCSYQAEWAALVPGSSTLDLTTVYKPLVVAGLAPDGSSVDFDTILQDALNWCLYCGAANTPAIVPYQLGTVTLGDMLVPQEQLKNVTCAELVVHLLRWAPNCALTIDYSEPTPGAAPTLTVVPRSTLGAVVLPAWGGSTSGLSEITPREDLQVSGAVIKYDVVNQVNNESYLEQFVDVYPTDINGLDFDALVAYVDLQGGRKTFETVKITTTTCPLSATDEVAEPWAKNQQAWIWAQTVPGTYDYDVANITVADVTTTLDPNDPAATDPPDGFAMDALVEELLTGEFKPWMPTEYGVYCAKVLKRVTLSCGSSTDPKTLAAFANGDTPGNFVFYVNMKATNASSGTFQHLTSNTAQEAPPSGLAQAQYEASSMLHYQGTIETTELECSGAVKMSNVINISGGRAEWATMSAQIMSIDEDIDLGKTTIRFGPPVTLGIQERVDLLRCWRIPHPPDAAGQQGTADAAQDEINGHQHAHHTSHVAAPARSILATGVWGLGINFKKPSGGDWQLMVNAKSTIDTGASTADQLTVSGLGVWANTTSSDALIFLQGSVTADEYGNLSSSAVTLFIGETGFSIGSAPWTSGAYVENSDGVQTFWRLKIADLDWSSGSPVAVPNVGSQLRIYAQQIGGLAAIYPGGV